MMEQVSKNNIWAKIKKGSLILAPMEDVTDTVFRQIVMSCGAPDIMYTEFTNCDGLASSGKNQVIHRLKYSQNERPIIAQIWGNSPQNYFDAACLVRKMGFDGVDINMGCPERSIIKQGACSALIDNYDKAKEIITSVQQATEGVIPVSVKTRIGFKSIKTVEWVNFLLQLDIDALILHGRTAKEQSKVPCHWDEIAKAVEIRDALYHSKNIKYIPVIGNGDVMSWKQAEEYVSRYKVDGIMIGRGVFQNPFIFNKSYIQNEDGLIVNTKTSKYVHELEFLMLLRCHIQLWVETWGDTKNYSVLKKYYKIYIQRFEGAGKLRNKIMETCSPDQALYIVDKRIIEIEQDKSK